jgi:hypothetical protein
MGSRTSAIARTAASSELKGQLARVRIGPVLHPAVLLALMDGASFAQHEVAHPRNVRIAGRVSFVFSMRLLLTAA